MYTVLSQAEAESAHKSRDAGGQEGGAVQGPPPLTPRSLALARPFTRKAAGRLIPKYSTVQGPCELILISSAPRVPFSRPELITNPYITRSLIKGRLALFPR